MPLHPYRKADPPPTPPQADAEDRVGPVRSVHPLLPLGWRLAPAIVVGAMLGVAGLFLGAEHPAFLFMVPGGAFAFALFGWSPLRARGTVVRLHADGVSVLRRTGVDVVPFEDVNELWYEVHVVAHGTQRFAHIVGLRLIDHAGRVVQVPLAVHDAGSVLTRILRQSSEHLLPEALRELGAGRTLTFGKVRIDRESVTIGRDTSAWSEIALVRFQSGRLAFFRRQTVVPWKTVGWDEVPHPGVFLKVVEEAAPKVEKD